MAEQVTLREVSADTVRAVWSQPSRARGAFYEGFGFAATGEVDDGEGILRLALV